MIRSGLDIRSRGNSEMWTHGISLFFLFRAVDDYLKIQKKGYYTLPIVFSLVTSTCSTSNRS